MVAVAEEPDAPATPVAGIGIAVTVVTMMTTGPVEGPAPLPEPGAPGAPVVPESG